MLDCGDQISDDYTTTNPQTCRKRTVKTTCDSYPLIDF